MHLSINTMNKPGKESGPLNFIHVAKCGGTTVRLFVDNLVHQRDIYPYYFSTEIFQNGHITPQRYQLVRGHLGRIPWGTGPIPKSSFTWLREPRDRLLSAFYFSKQGGKIPASANLTEVFSADRLDGRPKGYALSWLLFGNIVNKHTEPPEDLKVVRKRLLHRDPELVAEAIELLDSCRFVGMQDSFMESLNLLAYHTDSLAPGFEMRANRTLRRQRLEDLSTAERQWLDEFTEFDRPVFEHARKINRDNTRKLVEDLVRQKIITREHPGDWQSISAVLREQKLQRAGRTEQRSRIDFRFDRALLGSGWMERETQPNNRKNLGTWRWINVKTGAEIFFPLRRDLDLKILVGVCHFTDRAFLNQLELTVDEEAPVLMRRSFMRHPDLSCRAVLSFDLDASADAAGDRLTRLFFRCPYSIIPALENKNSRDFRSLALAFNWIAVQPASDRSIRRGHQS